MRDLDHLIDAAELDRLVAPVKLVSLTGLEALRDEHQFWTPVTPEPGQYCTPVYIRDPTQWRLCRRRHCRHTCGRRLRAAGVGLEDRQDILGHKSGRITTHYSAPEIGSLVAAVNRIADSRGIHARTVLRLVA